MGTVGSPRFLFPPPNALSRKNKELIALGISIVEKCFPCVEYHVSAALEHGATREEILETLQVAVVLGGGTASWPARFAFKVLDELPPGASQPPAAGGH
ncbi:MAG: carboxymuconolactone decarboxylase family protein [Acidobacteria bacterium]|nr:carboxymuconolactone decarboxylase family protein [Acidobacteriota bacterium]